MFQSISQHAPASLLSGGGYQRGREAGGREYRRKNPDICRDASSFSSCNSGMTQRLQGLPPAPTPASHSSASHSSAVCGCWLSHLHHCHLRKRNQISIASTPIKIGTETNPIISTPKCFHSAKAVHERAVTSPTTRALPSVQFVVVCISEGTFHNILAWQYPQQIVR